MTDLDAILAAILADPHDDTPRLVYAEICDDLAGVVACPRCGGSSKHDLNPYDLAARYGTYRAGLMLDAARCAVCAGSGSVSNGLAERAEFVRVQVELARMPRLLPANVLCHQVEWEHFAGRLSGSVGKVRFEPPAPGASSGVGVLHYGRRNPDREPLEKRERELFDAHAREWFGDSALWLPTDEPQRASSHVPGFVVRRGFVDEWRGPLSAFVGGECRGCGGEARVGQHHDPSSDTMRGGRRCPDCVDGRTPGLDLGVVFARHPVRSVRICDREPTHGQSGWYWMTGNNRPGEVPYRLTKHFQRRDKGYTRFPTRDAALSALSLAATNYGRAAAGLPPLT